MKTFRLLSIILMALLVLFSSCKKDEDLPAVENEDVSDLIENSMETPVYGIASQIEVAVNLAESFMAPEWCGYAGDSLIPVHYDGSAVQYAFSFDWSYNMVCAGTTPNAFNVDNHGNGNCATSVLSTNYNSWADWTLIGLTSSYAEYVLNGTYKRTGDFTSKLRDQHSFSCVLNMTLTDIRIDKTLDIVNSGSATISVVCTTDGGEEFTFSGTLVFNGNQNCTLTLEDKIYTIQL